MTWMSTVLGMEIGLVVEGPSGSITHAELWWGDAAVYVGTEPNATTSAVTCLAADSDADVDLIYGRATTSGEDIVQELTDTPFGSHQFAVRDPEGNTWTVGTYRPRRSTA